MGRPIPERSLFVREPWATDIVEGRKRWEVRRYPTRVRGRVGILSPRGLIGTVRIVDVLGPFTLDDMLQHAEQHRAPERFLSVYAGSKPLYAWVLEDPEAFSDPVPVRRPKGPQVWITRRHIERTTPP